MSINFILQRAARQSFRKVRLIRYAIGTYRDGIYSAEVKERREILASIQPLTSDQTDTTPENLVRMSSLVRVFSQEKLLVSDKTALQKADEIEIDGEVFTVESVADWRHRKLQHFEAIAARNKQ